MVISQKCNCCMHEKVCSKKDIYTGGSKDIAEISKHYGCEFDIHIKCPHFLANSRVKGNEDLPQNRGDQNVQ